MAKIAKQTATYLSFKLQAKSWGISLVAFTVLNEIHNGFTKADQFKGLGLSMSLVQHHLDRLTKDSYLELTDAGYVISSNTERLFKKEVCLPWQDSEEFWEIWSTWQDYRKETHGKVYKPIGQISALRNLVKWTNGDLEIAIEGIIWTMDREWQGLNYGIQEYLKSQSAAGSNRKQRSESRRIDLAEEINRRR